MTRTVSNDTVGVSNETVGIRMKQRDSEENHTKNALKNTGHFGEWLWQRCLDEHHVGNVMVVRGRDQRTQ